MLDPPECSHCDREVISSKVFGGRTDVVRGGTGDGSGGAPCVATMCPCGGIEGGGLCEVVLGTMMMGGCMGCCIPGGIREVT